MPRLTEILATPIDPRWRSAAAQALGAMGDAARPALPAFKTVREKHWLTVEDAQAIYRIDPAAETLHIPLTAPPAHRP